MKIIALFFCWTALNVQAYVINHGPVFTKDPSSFETQKSLFIPYYTFNTFNKSEQKTEDQIAKQKLEQVFKDKGYFLRINQPYRMESKSMSPRLEEHIFPFLYNRGGFFYLNNDSGIKTEYGLCSGFAHGLRKFDYLAFYDLDKEKESTDSYIKKIDLIFRNQPQVFYGVENLSELALIDDKVEFHIRKHLVDLWATNNSRDNIIYLYSRHYFEQREKLAEKHFTKLYKNTKSLLSYGFQPLLFHFWGAKTNIHILRVLAVSELSPDNKFSMTLYDFTGELKKVKVTIPVARWYQLLPREELEMGEYGSNLRKFCYLNNHYCLDDKYHPAY